LPWRFSRRGREARMRHTAARPNHPGEDRVDPMDLEKETARLAAAEKTLKWSSPKSSMGGSALTPSLEPKEEHHAR